MIGTAADITSYVHLLTFIDFLFHSHGGNESAKVDFGRLFRHEDKIKPPTNGWVLLLNNNAFDLQTLRLISSRDIRPIAYSMKAEGGKRMCMVREYGGDVIVRFL